MKKGSKMNSKKIFFLAVTLVLLFSFVFTGCINKPVVPVVSDATADPSTGFTPEPTKALATATATPDPLTMLTAYKVEIDQDIINILLVGNDSDSIDGDGNGRNDTTMVLQINRVDKTMKLISFMRDMVFDIPGVGETSLNNAYYHGGAYTLSKLLKNEFGIEIDYYASVSFNSFQSIMDVIGKVSIDPSQNIIPDINTVTLDVSKDPTNMSPQSSLNYVRDRYNSIIEPETGYTLYSDEARNYRQRVFISSVWETVKTYPTLSVPIAVYAAMAYLDTDIDENTAITLIIEMMDAGATIETLGLPARRSAEKPYYSLYEDLNSGAILAKSEIETIYQSASDKDSYGSFDEWLDEHYKVSHIIGWNVARTTAAIEEFLVTN